MKKYNTLSKFTKAVNDLAHRDAAKCDGIFHGVHHDFPERMMTFYWEQNYTPRQVLDHMNYALFHHAGHRSFYDMNLADVKTKKGIPPNEELLDCIGSLELSAHHFKAELTDESIKKKQIRGQIALESEHKRMGKVVRDTVHRETGTFPEDLPAEPSLKKLAQKRAPKQIAPPSISN